MTTEEQSVAEELQGILACSNADAMYDALPGTMSGKILNADLARELSPKYRCVADRIRYTRATYEPARDYVYERFMRTVKRPADNVAILLAGGAASGKSTSVQDAVRVADLVFDSNCADFAKACRMIDAATASSWAVYVIYVHRNFKAAVDGMLTRAIENGRYIPLRTHAGPDLATLHLSAQRTYISLTKQYADSPLVRLASIRNPWTPDNPAVPTGIADKTLAPGGKRHYNCVEDLYAIQEPIVQSYMASGKLPEELVSALGVA